MCDTPTSNPLQTTSSRISACRPCAMPQPWPNPDPNPRTLGGATVMSLNCMSTIRNVPAPCAFDEPATAADLGAGPPLLIADAGAMTGTSSTQRGANGKEKLERDIQGRSNGAWHPVVVPGGEVEVSFSCWDGQGRAVYKARGARSTCRSSLPLSRRRLCAPRISSTTGR